MIRRAVPESALSWQFPAGKAEPGESAEGAAVREAAEEAAVTVIARRVLGTRVQPGTGAPRRPEKKTESASDSKC